MRRLFLSLLAFGATLLGYAHTSHTFQSSQARPLAWRGVMIDVSRHFLPIDELYRQVDIMSHYGLNILHLHLTDAAGWRMEIKAYPRLTEVGAWRTRQVWKDWWNTPPHADGQEVGYVRAYSDSQNGFGGYYTQQQLRQLVAYAQGKGVTIVPEIEFPGHSEEVCAAYPEVAFNHAEMDLSNNATYHFMQTILKEVADVFPSPYIHCGGDETATQKDLYHQGIRRLNAIVRGMGRKMVVWDEAFSPTEADSTLVIMVWRNAAVAEQALALGHEVVMCPSGWCYLDSYQDAPQTQPEAMGGYRPLSHVWEVGQLIAPMRHRLLGLQACLFTEYVPTPQLLQYQLWPRALAVSEVGMGRTRPYEAFRKWAANVSDSLRRAGINAFDLRKEIGQRPEYGRRVRHKALGAKVRMNGRCHYSSAYAAGGDGALTDGLQGSWNNNDGRWQGYCCDLDIIIDLGAERTLHEVSIPFLQITGPEIFLPQQVTVNGEPCSAQPHDLPYAICTYTLRRKLTTRYLHIQAQRSPRQGWLFVDEVVAK